MSQDQDFRRHKEFSIKNAGRVTEVWGKYFFSIILMGIHHAMKFATFITALLKNSANSKIFLFLNVFGEN